MRMVVIDDEPFVLKDTVSVIKRACPKDEVIAFSDPAELLEFCLENPCEVAFLDVQMGAMDGRDLAAELKKESPRINIIFTTAYEGFYKDAMTLRASGYLLKPIFEKDVRDEILNLRFEPTADDSAIISVTCFGEFKVTTKAGEEIKFERKKAREAFAYLIHRCGKNCTSRDIAAVLFGDEPFDKKKQTYLQKIISTMMKTLKDYGVEEVIDKEFNSIRINVDKVDCDYYRYKNLDADVLDYRSDEYLEEFEWADSYYEF